MKWVICKLSRRPAPYTGPACDRIGVPKGALYSDPEEAEGDAFLMGREGHIGFTALALEDFPVRRYQFTIDGLYLQPDVADEIDTAVRAILEKHGSKAVARGFTDRGDVKFVLPHELDILEAWLTPKPDPEPFSEDW